MKPVRLYGTQLLQRFLSLPLRTHLFFMTSFLALPAIILIILSGLDKKNDSIREGIATGTKLSARIAMEQYNIIGDARQLASVLSQLTEIQRHDLNATTIILANILKLSPQYANIVIADNEGEIWASALPLTGRQSFRHRRSFLNAVRTRQFSSGEYNVDVITKKTTMGFGYPVLAKTGQVNDVILISLNFSTLNKSLGDITIPPGATYSIIDHKGIIIDQNPAASKTIGTQINNKLALHMESSGDDSNFIESAGNGEKCIYTSRKLRLSGEQSPYIFILTSIPLKGIQKNAKKALFKNIIILSPFLLLSFALVQRLSALCFVDPIDRLREVAHRLADGDLEGKASELVSGRELWELGQSFDHMAAKLRLREQELIRSERELNDLYNKAPCGYHSVDNEGTIVRINDTELSWLGYTRDDIVAKINFTELITPQNI